MEREIERKGYKKKKIEIGKNKDNYKKVEKKWRIMSEIIEVMEEENNKVGIVKK